MIDHIRKLRSLAEQLHSMGATVSEEDQVATLLCSLPDLNLETRKVNVIIVELKDKEIEINGMQSPPNVSSLVIVLCIKAIDSGTQKLKGFMNHEMLSSWQMNLEIAFS